MTDVLVNAVPDERVILRSLQGIREVFSQCLPGCEADSESGDYCAGPSEIHGAEVKPGFVASHEIPGSDHEGREPDQGRGDNEIPVFS